jgi:hypothetical protein
MPQPKALELVRTSAELIPLSHSSLNAKSDWLKQSWSIIPRLQVLLDSVRQTYADNVTAGHQGATMPHALANPLRRTPLAVAVGFPALRRVFDPHTRGVYRHHVDEGVPQRGARERLLQ